MKDNNGNILYRQGNAIKLQLQNEPHPRKLGVINEELSLLEIHRDSSKHLFQKNNSYGFNEALLSSATKFNKIQLIIDDVNIYLIPIKVIKEQGNYLNFKQQGFEIQIFLTLTIIEKYKQ